MRKLPNYTKGFLEFSYVMHGNRPLEQEIPFWFDTPQLSRLVHQPEKWLLTHVLPAYATLSQKATSGLQLTVSKVHV